MWEPAPGPVLGTVGCPPGLCRVKRCCGDPGAAVGATSSFQGHLSHFPSLLCASVSPSTAFQGEEGDDRGRAVVPGSTEKASYGHFRTQRLKHRDFVASGFARIAPQSKSKPSPPETTQTRDALVPLNSHAKTQGHEVPSRSHCSHWARFCVQRPQPHIPMAHTAPWGGGGMREAGAVP